MTSTSDWLYKVDGEVFGPISAQELLEELYTGEIDADTQVCPEGGSFKALSEYQVFESHLAKADSHQKQAAQFARAAKADKRVHIKRRLGLIIVTAIIAITGFGLTIYFVRSYRSEQVAQEEEAALESQLAELLQNVTIEPPLILDIPEEKPTKRRKGKRRRRRSKSKTTSKTIPTRTGKLTQGEVMAGVGQVFGGFKRCIVKQIQRDRSSVPTKIVLRFTIKNNGEVQSPTLDDRLLRSSPMMACMAGQIRSVRFRKFTGEVRNVEYPITIGAH